MTEQVEVTQALAEVTAQRDALVEALTPSADTKAAYMSEFSMGVRLSDERGNEQSRSITIPWTTIKEIMSAIRERATLASVKGQEQ